MSSMTNLDWLVENERDFVVDVMSAERCCRYCAFDDKCDGFASVDDLKCVRGNREWLLSQRGDAETDTDFVVYAGQVAKELYDEAFALLEGCDEPYFSAIDAVCEGCLDLMRIASRWQRLIKKEAAER